MTDKPPADVKHARFLKRAGLCRSIRRSRAAPSGYSRQWFALMDAQQAFMTALHEYDGSPARWRRAKARLRGLDKTGARCIAFMAERARNPATSAQDIQELAPMQWFITMRAIPFVDYWVNAFDAVDNGAELTIRPGDMPRWVDDE